MAAARMSARQGAALRLASSSDQESSFRAQGTAFGSSGRSQTSASAPSSFTALGSGAISTRKASTIGHDESTLVPASKALSSGLTSPAVSGSYSPGKGISS